MAPACSPVSRVSTLPHTQLSPSQSRGHFLLSLPHPRAFAYASPPAWHTAPTPLPSKSPFPQGSIPTTRPTIHRHSEPRLPVPSQYLPLLCSVTCTIIWVRMPPSVDQELHKAGMGSVPVPPCPRPHPAQARPECSLMQGGGGRQDHSFELRVLPSEGETKILRSFIHSTKKAPTLCPHCSGHQGGSSAQKRALSPGELTGLGVG